MNCHCFFLGGGGWGRVKHILENYLWNYVSKKCCVVTLLYMIIYEKCIMFNIAYGEMHKYLAWKSQASLI